MIYKWGMEKDSIFERINVGVSTILFHMFLTIGYSSNLIFLLLFSLLPTTLFSGNDIILLPSKFLHDVAFFCPRLAVQDFRLCRSCILLCFGYAEVLEGTFFLVRSILFSFQPIFNEVIYFIPSVLEKYVDWRLLYRGTKKKV